MAGIRVALGIIKSGNNGALSPALRGAFVRRRKSIIHWFAGAMVSAQRECYLSGAACRFAKQLAK